MRTRVLCVGKDPEAHSESRPDIVEAEAISGASLLSRYAGNRVHIADMRTEKGERSGHTLDLWKGLTEGSIGSYV